jgi:hypothetical protein
LVQLLQPVMQSVEETVSSGGFGCSQQALCLGSVLTVFAKDGRK